jgi:hypothetical protein
VRPGSCPGSSPERKRNGGGGRSAASSAATPAFLGVGEVADGMLRVAAVTVESSVASTVAPIGGSGRLEVAMLRGLRRRIPRFLRLCERGRRCEAVRYGKGGKVEEKGAGGQREHLDRARFRASMAAAMSNSGEKSEYTGATIPRVSKGKYGGGCVVFIGI